MQRRVYFSLLLLPALFAAFDRDAEAQGWSFTMTINYSGPCGAYRPQLPIFTIPFMPTQGYCESIRAQLTAISASVPVTDDHGNYIGDCTAYVSCTTCTGSDMESGSSSDPGSVSIDGMIRGNAFFSPHPSMGVENWIEDIQQKLRSMGYEVDAAKTLRAQDIPLTGNIDFDKYYAEQIIRFEKPEQGGSVYLKEGTRGIVDPNDLKNPEKGNAEKTNITENMGTVKMPSSNEQWYHLEPLENGGIPPLPESNNDPNVRYAHPRIELVREAGVTAAGWLPDGGAYAGILMVNVLAEDAKAIQDIRDGNNPQDFSTSMGNIIQNTVTDYKNQAVDDVKGMAFEKGLSIISGSKGFAKLASSADDLNSKWQDLGGTVAGGDGDGIFGKISQAAGWLGQPITTP